MVTIRPQYYEFLYILQGGTEATQQPNGSWAPGASGWTLKGACREETNGKGSVITTADGKALTFASLIQLPVGTTRVPEGTKVIVTSQEVQTSDLENEAYRRTAKESGLIVAEGVCLKFDFGRLHSRLWI